MAKWDQVPTTRFSDEAGADAEEELRRLRDAKFTSTIGNWKQVVKRFGHCIVNQLARITKLRRDGSRKIRMVIGFAGLV